MEYTKVDYAGGKKFIVENRAHKTIIDQPVSSDGSDEGITPPEAFIASLGSCIGVYVVAYCKSAGLNADGLTIAINWEKETVKKPAFIKNINAKISLPNANVGGRKKALLRVAENCLIHETIRQQPFISIDLV